MEEEEVSIPDYDETAAIEEEPEEEIKVIKKRKPRFTEQHLQKMRDLGRTPESIEKLKRMNEIKKVKAKQRRIEKMKEELEREGLVMQEKKEEEPKSEPVVIPVEQPKIETPVVPKTEPTPAVIVPVEQPKIETPPKQVSKKKKPKRKVEYVDDETDEDIYDDVPVYTKKKELTEEDIHDYLTKKVTKMNLKEMEDRMIRRQYQNEMQRLKEEAMSKMISGVYF